MKAEVKMQVRLPTEIRDALAQDAKNNERSMNGQIIAILKEHFRAAGLTKEPIELAPPRRN
ncbi:Arc family DNA-binding protein [Burkholderia sp. BCC1985]|uniref:Arc family DNA-binding protein n=1 Tax=Burkholderia sp. BCC1985 TaxID=2817442 RepID=UPI002AAF90A2|nr:Arc family DNA-binding protein [Burkholderia sp. BCC1985]